MILKGKRGKGEKGKSENIFLGTVFCFGFAQPSLKKSQSGGKFVKAFSPFHFFPFSHRKKC
jgi:hypothetical protein